MRHCALVLLAAACTASPEGDPNDHVEVPLEHDQLVVVRVHGTVESCKRRMLEDFTERAKGHADVLVTYDPSMGSSKIDPRKRRAEIAKQLAPLPVLVFGGEATVRGFPKVRWPMPCLHRDITPQAAASWPDKHLCRPGPPRGKTLSNGTVVKARGWHLGWAETIRRRYGKDKSWEITQAVNYVLHEPTLVLVLRHLDKLQQRGRLSRMPKIVWTVEHDAAFAHDLPGFFSYYGKKVEAKGADLITVVAHSIRRKKLTTNYLLERYPFHVNTEFINRFPVPRFKWEHVDGYSVRLLRRLGELMDAGAAATGEFFAITACLGDSSFQCQVSDMTADGFVAKSQECFADSAKCPEKVVRTCAPPSEKAHAKCKRKYPQFAGKWLHKVGDWCMIPKYRGSIRDSLAARAPSAKGH